MAAGETEEIPFEEDDWTAVPDVPHFTVSARSKGMVLRAAATKPGANIKTGHPIRAGAHATRRSSRPHWLRGRGSFLFTEDDRT